MQVIEKDAVALTAQLSAEQMQKLLVDQLCANTPRAGRIIASSVRFNVEGGKVTGASVAAFCEQGGRS